MAGPGADTVHVTGAFPREAVDALKDARLLGVMVPEALGGEGAGIDDVVAATRVLAQHCASTGMIFAMHQIQLGLIVHHGATPMLDAFLEEVASGQLLIASAASEVGVGGDARRSVCALEPVAGGFHLEKQATCVSYGAEADAILATARRGPDAAPDEQAWAVLRPPRLSLDPMSDWDAFGLRGTDSRGFRVVADVDAGMVLANPNDDALDRTGVAINNLLQCTVWLGIAEAAAGRAHAAMRARARKDPEGSAIIALRMAELAVPLQELRDVIAAGTRRADAVLSGAEDALVGMPLAIASNTLKVAASTRALDVVHRSMMLCGIDGYRAGPSSLGRHVADIYGGLIMVNNDRLLGGNSELLKILKSL